MRRMLVDQNHFIMIHGNPVRVKDLTDKLVFVHRLAAKDFSSNKFNCSDFAMSGACVSYAIRFSRTACSKRFLKRLRRENRRMVLGPL